MVIASFSEYVERAIAEHWAAGKPPGRHKTNLKIHDRKPGGRFDYEFDRMEILKLDATPIEISLDSGSTPDNKHKIRIVDHTCSRPSAVSFAYAFDIDDVFVTDFSKQFCQRLGLHVALQKNEMVNIGVIVEVLDQQGAFVDLLLCDPQVGNGPGTLLPAWSLLAE